MNSIVSRIFLKTLRCTNSYKEFHKSSIVSTFWERHEKGGYQDDRPEPSNIKKIRDGLKELKSEIKLWSEEVKEHFESDPVMIFRPGETDVAWKFDSENSLNQWIVTSDKDNNEGYSSCSLKLNKYGKGVFSGELNTRVPQDGRTKRAGYCNIKTLRARVTL